MLYRVSAWLAGALLLAALAAAWRLLPLDELISRVAEVTGVLGWSGIAFFTILHLSLSLTIGPVWIMPVAAGLAFGFRGLAIVLPAVMVSAIIGFLIARHGARDRIASYIRQRPNLEAIDRAVAQHGFVIVLLLRLSPAMPFGAKGYVLGLSSVSFGSYIAGTLIGIIPGSFLYVYVGVAGALAFEGPAGTAESVMLLAGLVITVLLVLFIGQRAQNHLRQTGLEVNGDRTKE